MTNYRESGYNYISISDDLIPTNYIYILYRMLVQIVINTILPTILYNKYIFCVIQSRGKPNIIRIFMNNYTRFKYIFDVNNNTFIENSI